MYGDAGAKLVAEAKRAANLDLLPEYHRELVTAISREIEHLWREAELLKDQNPDFQPNDDPALGCQILTRHLAMRRNKRCLFAYHRSRADRIDAQTWHGGKGELSPAEEEYRQKYADLIGGYKDVYADIDLGGSMEPPRDLFVDVRVMKDAGEIQTEYGVLTLTKNSQFFVRQGDVERLIQQGYLAVVG